MEWASYFYNNTIRNRLETHSMRNLGGVTNYPLFLKTNPTRNSFSRVKGKKRLQSHFSLFHFVNAHRWKSVKITSETSNTIDIIMISWVIFAALSLPNVWNFERKLETTFEEDGISWMTFKEKNNENVLIFITILCFRIKCHVNAFRGIQRKWIRIYFSKNPPRNFSGKFLNTDFWQRTGNF